jgi:hypothetical protein
MSTSNPLIAPLGADSSIGGNDGSVQYLNVVELLDAPALPTAINTTVAASASQPILLPMSPSST